MLKRSFTKSLSKSLLSVSAILLFYGCLPLSKEIDKNLDSSKYPLISKFSEINKNQQNSYSIKAYVTDVYKCPPCPDGAMCKPCIGNHIIISDLEPGNKSAINENNSIRAFVDNPDQFQINKKYLFSLTPRKPYRNYEADIVSSKQLN